MADKAPAIDLSKYIEARFFGERPHVRSRRVPVAAIAYNHKTNNWDVAKLMYNFTLNEAGVLAALLYYEENQELIDAQERAEQKLGDEMFEKYGGFRPSS